MHKGITVNCKIKEACKYRMPQFKLIPDLKDVISRSLKKGILGSDTYHISQDVLRITLVQINMCWGFRNEHNPYCVSESFHSRCWDDDVKAVHIFIYRQRGCNWKINKTLWRRTRTICPCLHWSSSDFPRIAAIWGAWKANQIDACFLFSRPRNWHDLCFRHGLSVSLRCFFHILERPLHVE